jgi:hypothetical protein
MTAEEWTSPVHVCRKMATFLSRKMGMRNTACTICHCPQRQSPAAGHPQTSWADTVKRVSWLVPPLQVELELAPKVGWLVVKESFPEEVTELASVTLTEHLR